MPLIHVIGQSSTNTTFSIALGLILTEDEASYIWALTTLFGWLNPMINYIPTLHLAGSSESL